MIAEEIRELLEREPFQAFRIRSSSGIAYDVVNPSLAVVMKSQVLIAAPRSDRYSIVPFLHVAGLELRNGGRAGRPARRKRR